MIDKVATWQGIQSEVESVPGGCMTWTLGREISLEREWQCNFC